MMRWCASPRLKQHLHDVVALGCLVGMLMLAGCQERPTEVPPVSAGPEAAATLPAPQQNAGSVTGMPAGAAPSIPQQDMVTAPVPTPDATMPDASAPASDANPANASDGTMGSISEPTPEDAVQVLRDYYAAINRQAYDAAYALWRDHGRASGLSAAKFANGFADTRSVDVEFGRVSAVEGAAGSRYIRVPIRVTATQRDDSTRVFDGSYALRRAVVDGATAEHRQWRIESAQLKEIQ